MKKFCFVPTNTVVKYILDYHMVTTNELNKCMTRLKGKSITNSRYFKNMLEVTHGDTHRALQNTLYTLLNVPVENNKEFYTAEFWTQNSPQEQTQLIDLQNATATNLTFYQRHPQYAACLQHSNQLQQALKNGEITDNTIKELCNELTQAITVQVNACFRKASLHHKPQNEHEQIIFPICEACDFNVLDRPLFYNKLFKANQQGFSHIVQLALDYLNARMKSMDNVDPQTEKDFNFLQTNLDAFILMIAPQLKRTEGILPRQMNVDQFQLNQYDKEIVTQSLAEYDITLDDLSEQNERDDTEVDKTSNDTVTSRTHFEDALAVNMEENLSSRLIKLFRSIPLDATNPNRFTRFGTPRFYDERGIYKDLVERCYLCKDSQDLLKFLQSEEFDAPYKTSLLQRLSPTRRLSETEQINNGRNLTELWTAIHAARNQYNSTSATDKAVDTAIVNRIQSKQVLQDLFFQCGTQNSVFITLTDDKLNYTVNQEQDKNISAIRGLLTSLTNKSFFNGTLLPAIHQNKTNPKKYFIDNNGSVFPCSDIINIMQHQSIWSNCSVQQQVVLQQMGLNKQNTTIENVTQKILQHLGLDSILAQPDQAVRLLLYRWTNAQGNIGTYDADRFITAFKTLNDLLEHLQTSKSVAHRNGYNTFKKLCNYMNTPIGKDLQESVYHDKKTYQTTSPLNYIQDLFNSFQYNTKADWEALLKQTTEDEFAGHFYNQEWFYSILKTTCNTALNLLSSSGASADTRLDQIQLKQIPQLETFLDFNNQSWGEIDDLPYTLASIVNFFNFSKQSGNIGVGKLNQKHKYLLPTFEAKGQAYYMAANAFDSELIEELQEHGYTQSEVAQKRASMVMQEIHRIRCSYEREIQRTIDNDTYVNKNDGIDDCKLITKQNADGVNNKILHLIDFKTNDTKSELAIGERKLGGARFYFVNTFNRFLEFVNDFNDENDKFAKLNSREQDVVKLIRRYIYGGHIDGIVPIEEGDLLDMVYVIADIVEQDLNDEYQQFLRDNDVFGENYDIFVQMSGLSEHPDVKRAQTIAQKQFNEEIQQRKNDLLTNVNLSVEQQTEAQNQLTLQQMAYSALDNSEVKSQVDKLLRYYFYNHLLFNEQAYHLLFNDLMRLKDSNNVQKRAGMAVSTGTACDEGATIATSTINTCMLADFNGSAIQPLLHTNELDFMCQAYESAHLAHIKSVFPNENSKGYQVAYETLQRNLNNFRASWQEIDGTDGQSIMSIPMMKKHWNMLGRASAVMNTAFDMLTEIYQMEPSDPNLETKLTEYYQFVQNNFGSWDIETQKTFTAGKVSMTDVLYENELSTREITWQQPLSIKTADYICLDPRAIMDSKNPQNMTFLWGLNKFLIEQNLDRACYGTAVKHNQVKLLQVPQKTTETNSNEHLTTLFNNWTELCKNNPKQYVLSYPARWTKHQLETHAHFLDAKAILGVQFQKMITESVQPESQYVLPDGTQMNGQEILDLVDSLYQLKTDQIVESIRDKYQINETTALTAEQKLQEQNYKLSRLLTRQLENSNEFSFNAWWGLQLNERGEFNIPLDTPSNLQFITKLIFSLVKNDVIKQKVNGGQLVQVADIHGALKRIQQGVFGKDDISDDESLNIEFAYENDDPNGKIIGIKALEVEMPLYAQPLIDKYLQDDGTVLSQKLIEEQPELAKLIGYRIPTEGYCSMFTMKVKRFTNPMGGGNIKFPAAITKITGSDFDIDKIFFIAPTMNKDGEYISPNQLLQQLLNNENTADFTEDTINNALLTLWVQVLEHPDTMVERITPGGFDTFVYYGDVISNMKYYMLNDDLSATDAYMKAINDNKSKTKRNFLYGRSISNPDVQKAFHVRNNIGKKSVGVFANPRQVHAFLTRYQVDLLTNSMQNDGVDIQNLSIDGRDIINTNHVNDLTYEINGQRCLKYDSEYCFDELTKISNILRELLSSSVDAVKKPILDGLNINDATINLVIPLVRLGFNFEQIILLLQQPIVKKWCKIYLRRKLELTAQGETYLDATQLFLDTMGMSNKIVNLNLTTRDLQDPNKPGSLVIGLSQTADDIEQQALLPLLYKALKISEDLRFMNGKVKIDSSSENTWSDFFGYVKFLVDQQMFDNRLQTHASEFNESFLNIFDETKSNHSKKLTSCYNGITELIDEIVTMAIPQLSIERFVQMIIKLSQYAGGRTLSETQIRNMFHSYQAFMYHKYKRANNITEKGMDFWVNEFPFIFSKACAQANMFSKYRHLLHPQYGLHTQRTNHKITKQFYPDTPTIGVFLKDLSENIRNDMRNDWAAMLNDHTEMVGTSYTWSQFGQLLVEYVINKNGFSVTNNSFAQLIPYNALEHLPALKHYTTQCEMNDESIEQFLELFARHERIAYFANSNDKTRDQIKRYNVARAEELLSTDELKQFGSDLPKFISCQYEMFIRIGSSNDYKHVCQLGAAGIGVEYHPDLVGKNTGTYFIAKNQNWSKKNEQATKTDMSGHMLSYTDPAETLFEDAKTNFNAAIEKIKPLAEQAGQTVYDYMWNHRSSNTQLTWLEFNYFNTGLPQFANKDVKELKQIYNKILNEFETILKEKKYCLK